MGWSDYSKVKKIGEGSFGAAWLVKNNKDTIQYVIKQINVSRMSPKEKDEARKEVSVLAQMKHPNIVSYIDSFEEMGNLCIVMDYCEGGDLHHKLQSLKGQFISEDQLLDWFVQITLALKHIHDRKILHRDLKSQNIFLTKDGSIKLGDFGVAKVLSNTMDLARTAIGTPYYMSPEICDRKPYNNKSDVWSLGCVLYEMANNRHPFQANNMQMLIVKILKANFDPLNPKYSYDLRNLVSSMLKKNPSERPSVNGILRKAFIMKRCAKFLTNEKLAEEFSHTVLHGENFHKKIQSLNAVNKPGVPVASNKPTPTPTPRSSSAQRQPVIVSNNAPIVPKPSYDAAKIYRNPVVPRESMQVQKSADKKPNVEPRKVLNSPKPTPIGVQYQDVERKPQAALSYLEQQKQKKAFEEALLKKKQKELMDKQKQQRINKAREEGWQNVLLSSSENKSPESEKYPLVNANRGANNENIYARYHDQLNELQNKRDEINVPNNEKPQDYNNNDLSKNQPVRPNSGAGRALPPALLPNKYRPSVVNNSPVSEFARRREEFERNRAKGKGLINNPLVARPPLYKNDVKSSYEEKLRQIRFQNYNNRRLIANEASKRKSIECSDNQNKKIAALRQQSDEQRNKLHNNYLEKRRQEAFEKEKQIETPKPLAHVTPNGQKHVLFPKDIKPAPPVNMTEVFSAIGIVGKQISKEEVLRDLNSNSNSRPSSSRQISSDRSSSNNKKAWNKGTNLSELDNKTLILDSPSTSQKPIVDKISPRKAWDLPHETIIKAFSLAELCEDSTKLIAKNGSKINRTIVINENNELLINEQPPSTLKNVDNLKETSFFITPEKLATMKASKNILLGVTLGQYDLENKTLLRTCSEPDIKTLFSNDDANQMQSDAKISENPEESSGFKHMNKTGTVRFAKSLDDLSKIIEENVVEIVEVGNYEPVMASRFEVSNSKKSSSFKSDDSDKLAQDDDEDMNNVRLTMQSFLDDSDSSDERNSTIKSPIVSQKLEKKKNVFTIKNKNANLNLSDSLEISKVKLVNGDAKFKGDNDQEEEEEDDDDSGSDTEFEEDGDDLSNKLELPQYTVKLVSSFHSLEKKRADLEFKLGTEKFLEIYTSIQNLVLKEKEDPQIKTQKLKDRKSFLAFVKLHPSENLEIYNELCDLIIADTEFNEN